MTFQRFQWVAMQLEGNLLIVVVVAVDAVLDDHPLVDQVVQVDVVVGVGHVSFYLQPVSWNEEI